MKFKELAPSSIEHADNYRANLELDDDFVTSIKVNGVVEPIVVTANNQAGKWRLVVGARRLAAARKLRLKLVPCVVVDPLTDGERLAVGVVENTQRRNTTAVEEAKAIGRLLSEGWIPNAIATRLGRTPAYVHRHAQLLHLSPHLQQLLHDGALPLPTAFKIARLNLSAAEQEQACDALAATPDRPAATPRTASAWLSRHLHLRLSQAPWSLADAKLVPAAKACRTCPHRSKAQQNLFDSNDDQDLCLLRSCYDRKLSAYWEKLKQTDAERCVPATFDEWGHLADSRYVDLAETDPSADGPNPDQVLFARDQRGFVHRLMTRPVRVRPPASPAPTRSPTTTTEPPSVTDNPVPRAEAPRVGRAVRDRVMEVLDRALDRVHPTRETMLWLLKQRIWYESRPVLVSFVESEGNLAEGKTAGTITDAELRAAAIAAVDRLDASREPSVPFALLVELEAHAHVVQMADDEVPRFIRDLTQHVSVG